MAKIELKPNPTEDEIQIAFIDLCRSYEKRYPELRLVFHIPNGSHKSPVMRRKFQLLGLKPGVPDIFLPVPNGIYNGLFIELKRRTGQTSPEQRKWLRDLEMEGYKTVVTHSFEETVKVVEEYLHITLPYQ